VTFPERAAGSWRIDGQPASTWVREHQRSLVGRALAGLRNAEEPGGSRDQQLQWIVDYNLGLFVRFLDEPGLTLDEVAAADLVASAANRAGEGNPIESLLQDYVTGMAAIWGAIAEKVRPKELPDLIRLTAAFFEYLRSVVVLVVRGFQHEATNISMGERDARFATYSALISGSDPENVAIRAGIGLSQRYLVLSLHLGGSSETAVPGRATQVPRLRRANAVRRILNELAVGDLLALMRDPMGTALVPLTPQPAPSETADIQALLVRLTDALQAPVHAGAVIAAPKDIPAAVAQADEILQLVLAIGRPAGAWFLDDVLIPYQLTRPGPALDLLAARMRALDSHPDWEETLRAFLANGYDRRRTAKALFVHPNTVDYRLDRIAKACGIDAAEPAGRPAALAALYVRDIENHHTDQQLDMSQK
jgi:hypothetical protein